MLVDGSRYHHARNAAQIGEIEQAVMRHAVLAHYAATVKAEGDGQVLDGNIVNDVVVGTLQERTVDAAEWVPPFLGKTT